MGHIQRLVNIILLCSTSIWPVEKKMFSDATSAIRRGKVIAHTPTHVLHKADSYNNSLLHYATYYQRWHTAFFLLQYGLSPNHPNHQGHTPFHIALRNGDERLTRLLLAHSASGTKCDASGDPPMHTLISQSYINLIPILAEMRPESVDVFGRDGETPIHRAIHTSNSEAARMLLAHEAHTDIFDRNGCSLFYYALAWGQSRIANMLLTYIDLDNHDASGNHPVHHAVHIQHDDILSRILTLNPTSAHKRTRETSGRLNRGQRPTPIANTPLHEAHSGNAIDILCSHNADITSRNAHGITPLLYAIKRYYKPHKYQETSADKIPHVIQRLIANGALQTKTEDAATITSYLKKQHNNQPDDIYLLITSAIQLDGSIPYNNTLTLPQDVSKQNVLLHHAHDMGYSPALCMSRFHNHRKAIPTLKEHAHKHNDTIVTRMIGQYEQQEQLANLQNLSYFCDTIIHLSQ